LPFLTGNRTAILKLDPHGKSVAIDVERGVHVLGVQIWKGRIMKTPDFAPLPELVDEWRLESPGLPSRRSPRWAQHSVSSIRVMPLCANRDHLIRHHERRRDALEVIDADQLLEREGNHISRWRHLKSDTPVPHNQNPAVRDVLRLDSLKPRNMCGPPE